MRIANDVRILDLSWDGPFGFDDVAKNFHGSTDYGVYQIYGTHAVFGPDALLYIGMAEKNPFGQRIPDHDHWIDWEPSAARIYLGRLCGTDKMTEAGDAEWCEMIRLAESLLIYFCSPPYNSKNIKTLGDHGPTMVQNFRRYHRLPRIVSNLYETAPVSQPDFKPYGW